MNKVNKVNKILDIGFMTIFVSLLATGMILCLLDEEEAPTTATRIVERNEDRPQGKRQDLDIFEGHRLWAKWVNHSVRKEYRMGKMELHIRGGEGDVRWHVDPYTAALSNFVVNDREITFVMDGIKLGIPFSDIHTVYTWDGGQLTAVGTVYEEPEDRAYLPIPAHVRVTLTPDLDVRRSPKYLIEILVPNTDTLLSFHAEPVID